MQRGCKPLVGNGELFRAAKSETRDPSGTRARPPPPSTRFFSLLPLLLSLLLCDVDNRIPRSSWLILPRAKYRGVERGRNVTNVDWGKISLRRIVMAIRQHFFSSIKRSNSWLFRSYLRDLGRCCLL